MIGIYKITNPENEIYIGQSINIEKRFYGYQKLHCECQPVLYLSLLKHSVKNHFFEIIEECEIHELNERERYWQDVYNLSHKLLNMKLVGTNKKIRYVSDDDRKKLKLPEPKKIMYVLDTQNGVYYNTISEAVKYNTGSNYKITDMLLGLRKNTTNLILV